MEATTNLLIIGAGPYGLAIAAYARHLGIDHVVVGKPMEFWKANMPEGITREPDLARVHEHRVYKSYRLGEGELPTATGHRIEAANPAVLRSRIPDDACRIHGDAMGIGAR